MEPAKLLTDLPTDALGLVLCKLTLAHEIAAVAPTCHVVSDAVGNAFKVRPFSREVVTLRHEQVVTDARSYAWRASPSAVRCTR